MKRSNVKGRGKKKERNKYNVREETEERYLKHIQKNREICGYAILHKEANRYNPINQKNGNTNRGQPQA
jgi:abortive infection bacteriophage resistance protein